MSQSSPTNLDAYAITIDQTIGKGMHLFGMYADTCVPFRGYVEASKTLLVNGARAGVQIKGSYAR